MSSLTGGQAGLRMRRGDSFNIPARCLTDRRKGVIEFEPDIRSGLAVRAERDDLNEILGNLLENAVQHAKGKVLVRAKQHGSQIRFDVEDDGPGIADTQRKAVINRGKRLDSSAVGAGLGLAIVSDVLDHYGQKLTLNRSDLGGLKASFELEG